MTTTTQEKPVSNKPASAKSEYVFVTTDYHGRDEQLVSIQRFPIGAPSKNQEFLTVGWGTTKILRRHWEWLAYKDADGNYPNDPSGVVRNNQIILSVDGHDFFRDFVTDAKMNSGALLTRKHVVNNVFNIRILSEWINMASNYTTDQAAQIPGFANIRLGMEQRRAALREGAVPLAGTKPLEPVFDNDDDFFDDY